MSGKYIYEVLIRGGASGVRGAHVVEAVDSVNPLTNELRTDIGVAQPVQLGAELEAILGSATTAALAENDTLKTYVSEQAAALDQLASDKERLTAEKEALAEQAAANESTISDLSTELGAVKAERDALREQLSILQTALVNAAVSPKEQSA